MDPKTLSLELAAFLDSRAARTLVRPSREDVRRVAEAFLVVCYDELGKKPELLDGEDVREAVVRLLPRRLAPKDPVAEDVPAVLEAFVEHLEEARVVPNAFEVRRALEPAVEEMLAIVRSGGNAEDRAPVRRDPFVHGASKLGRNDPCSCGSGKKYKKCHGKGA